MTEPSQTDLPGLYRSDAIRAIEHAATARYGLDEDALMARAAQAAWRLLRERWPLARRIGIACGPGNNGGDGYALARIALEAGYEVRVVALARRSASGTAGSRAAMAFGETGGVAVPYRAGARLPNVDVWVDALFGAGLHRALEGEGAAIASALNAHSAPILSMDLPSGIDSDTGASPGASVRATLTLAFIAATCGLCTGAGRAAAGEVLVDPLGLPTEVFEGIAPTARLAGPPALHRWLPPRPRDAHKGLFGHVLCMGGDQGFGGAISLCGQAALRSGAGLVSVATRTAHVTSMLAMRSEWMVRGVEDAASLEAPLQRASVVAIGPGLGRGAWAADLLAAALAAGKPMVIDADALNLLASAPRHLADAVLTPHPGEAGRLLGRPVPQLECDRIGSACELAQRFHSTVVWKGAGTVVAAPGRTPVVIDAGNPGMASGGMGDLLTGVIAALRAQGLAAFDAAVCGALLHAAAGDAAAAECGQRGLLASDLYPHLHRLANPCA